VPRSGLARNKGALHLVDLKTGGSMRTLHLSAPRVDVLDRHRRRQEAEGLLGGVRGRNEHELIFTSTIGTPLDPEAFGRTVPKICEEAGLGHWSIHELRHKCASLLLAQEVPLEVVAEQLGHASIRVTKDVYGHLMPRSRARAADVMRTFLYDDSSRTMPQASSALATPVATPHPWLHHTL
jgi:integrase